MSTYTNSLSISASVKSGRLQLPENYEPGESLPLLQKYFDIETPEGEGDYNHYKGAFRDLFSYSLGLDYIRPEDIAIFDKITAPATFKLSRIEEGWTDISINFPHIQEYRFYGPGMDCDTCGTNSEEGKLLVSHDIGYARLEAMYGCYGGALGLAYLDTIEGAQFVEDEIKSMIMSMKHMSRFMTESECKRGIKELKKVLKSFSERDR